jgi:hypothetical protein
MGNDPDLQRLVEQGKRRQADEDRAERSQKRASRHEDVGRRLNGVSFFSRFGWIPLGILFAFGAYRYWEPHLPPLAPVDVLHEDEQEDSRPALSFGCLLGGLAVSALLRRPVGHWAWRREEAWVAALPFPLRGYPDLLSHGSNDCTVTVRFGFSGATPDRETLEAVVRTFGRLEKDGEASTRFDFSESESGGPMTSGFLRSHARTVIARLQVLHRSYPLDAVTMSVR